MSNDGNDAIFFSESICGRVTNFDISVDIVKIYGGYTN